MENCQEIVTGCLLTLKNEVCRKITKLGFFPDLSRDRPATADPNPPQRLRPGGNNPAPAAYTEIETQNLSSKLLFHNTPSTLDVHKLSFHAKINFRSSTRPNSIS
uniref:Uncharacterized protein n=1 Tax=Solanum tuberosum TaxID=4113 RepID=M1DJA3_SOLTU